MFRNTGSDVPAECLNCGAALPDKGIGRPASYCSQACRQRAYRSRRSATAGQRAGRRAGAGAGNGTAPLRERAVPHLSSRQLQAWRGALEIQALLLPKLEAELREETGLTISEFDVLHQLWRAPGGVRRVGDLANDVLVTPGGITHLADRLVDRGLIERHRREGRQAVELSLTGAGGHQLRAAMNVVFAGVRTKFVDLLEPEEVELLAALWARLQAHYADGG